MPYQNFASDLQVNLAFDTHIQNPYGRATSLALVAGFITERCDCRLLLIGLLLSVIIERRGSRGVNDSLLHVFAAVVHVKSRN
jgi:hypothetical protein